MVFRADELEQDDRIEQLGLSSRSRGAGGWLVVGRLHTSATIPIEQTTSWEATAHFQPICVHALFPVGRIPCCRNGLAITTPLPEHPVPSLTPALWLCLGSYRWTSASA